MVTFLRGAQHWRRSSNHQRRSHEADHPLKVFHGFDVIINVVCRLAFKIIEGDIMRLSLLILAVIGFLPTHSAWAATQTVVANISFDTALSIVKGKDISFGTLKASQSGTYTLSTSGSVIASDNGVWFGGSPQPGSVTIAGSTTQAINISANNYAASNGVTPSGATCSYNGGPSIPCSLASQEPPGLGKVLLLGVTVVVDGSQAMGSTATPSFEVVVTYQ